MEVGSKMGAKVEGRMNVEGKVRVIDDGEYRWQKFEKGHRSV